MARDINGDVFTWGYNNKGKLGDGSSGVTEYRTSPFKVDLAGKKAKRISAGSEHSAIITTDNEALLWGDNEYGQLGDGTTLRKTILTPLHSSVASNIINAQM